MAYYIYVYVNWNMSKEKPVIKMEKTVSEI